MLTSRTYKVSTCTAEAVNAVTQENKDGVTLHREFRPSLRRLFGRSQCLISSDPILCDLSVNETGFVPGETLMAYVTVKNGSDQPIKMVHLSLLQGFLTAMRQEIARANKYALDDAVLTNDVTRMSSEDVLRGAGEGLDNVHLWVKYKEEDLFKILPGKQCIKLTGERKGTNKYYPPDFDPKRHKSLNAYHGVHALRERGRKADQGVLIIRFEMPFNCWCLSCKKPIGMGVRYNAEKRKVGMYHSTPIYQFTMNCAMCAGAIVIQTDPQNFDYTCIEGVRRKCQTWDPEENEQIVIPDYKEKQKLAVDAMYQVEHGVKDKEKAAIVHPAIADLEASKSAFKDDFALNCLVRKQFRDAKRAANKAASRDEALVSRLSLAGSQVKLLPEVDDDASKAKLIRLMHRKYQGTSSKDSKAGLENHVLFQSTSRASVPASISRQNTSSRSQSNSTDSEGTVKADSLALHVTKETVRAHWMAQRAGAFSTSTKSGKEPLHHTDLSAAVKSGLIRRVSTSGDSGNPDCSPIQAQKIDEMLPPPSMPGAGLVGYDDSD